jgi:hypothetical protein
MHQLTAAKEVEASDSADSKGSAPAAAGIAAAASSSSIPSSPLPPTFSPRSVCDGTCLVVRLWHMDVFVGARESARGDPGAYCRDIHFAPQLADTGAAVFRHQISMADTDAIMEAE